VSGGQESMPQHSTPRVVIVCNNRPKPSETFVQAHIDRFAAGLPLVHGWSPMAGSHRVLPLVERLVFKVRRMVLGESPAVQTTAGYLRAFRRMRPDVVLAEFGDVGVRVMEACARLDIPLVVHFHGYDASRTDVIDSLRDAYRHLFAQAAAVIAVSSPMVQTLVDLGCPRHTLHHIPCGVDCSRFRDATPATSPPVFVAVGRLIEKKGPLATIVAFAEVARRVPEARLRLIGDGSLRPACEQLRHQLGLDHAVTLLGVRPPDSVAQELRSARAFVQHSLRAVNGDSEGTPVAVMEAGASGLPIVATRHGGIPDVVVDGETGLLVDEGDAAGMGRAMLALAEDPARAARLGLAGRLRICDRFSSTMTLGQLEQRAAGGGGAAGTLAGLTGSGSPG
jgi:colanic acid/amylovoran biosynthesis glycosyltransferase